MRSYNQQFHHERKDYLSWWYARVNVWGFLLYRSRNQSYHFSMDWHLDNEKYEILDAYYTKWGQDAWSYSSDKEDRRFQVLWMLTDLHKPTRGGVSRLRTFFDMEWPTIMLEDGNDPLVLVRYFLKESNGSFHNSNIDCDALEKPAPSNWRVDFELWATNEMTPNEALDLGLLPCHGCFGEMITDQIPDSWDQRLFKKR